MQKSAAVQASLIENPRTAMEIGVAHMLRAASCHPCLRYLADLGEDVPALDAINAEAAALCAIIGIKAKDADFATLVHCACTDDAAYDLVKPLSDSELTRLFAFLSAVNFGQVECGALDTRQDSIFNRVAADLSVDMRSFWTPAKWFLSRRTAKQLGCVIREAGLTRLFGSGMGYKKGELVTALARYFRKVRSFDDPAPDQKQARDWLPEAMRFPAVDVDALSAEQDESEQNDEIAHVA